MTQDGCSDSSQHDLTPDSRKREGAKKNALLPFKDNSQKLPVIFFFFNLSVRNEYMSYTATKEPGKCGDFFLRKRVQLKVVCSRGAWVA